MISASSTPITPNTSITTTTTTKDEAYWSQLATSFVDKVIDEEYQLLELLGHGAYGCLFLGQSLRDNSYVAIKILLKSRDLQQLQLQQLEMDIQSQLKHPHLLALHRVIQDQDYIYMIMELCDQGDLFDFVIKDQESSFIRDESLVKEWFTQILDAVEHMHAQGVYHRDIKLENILLKQEQENTVCKVADFGLATRERYSMEFGCGSTSYLAPEHFDDDSELVPYDAAASDTWSLGILLLAFMFGRNPWQEASHSDPAYHQFTRHPTMLKEHLFPELSLATLRWLQAALAPNGSDRPSVAALKEQFLSIDRLYATEEEEDKLVDLVHIPTATKHTNMNSYDSAFFSAGMSWSDMVEEDEAYLTNNNTKQDMDHHFDIDDEDTDMFVHSGEKESWWL
ncbi:kinase-like protein [Rhizopus microsporus var. microsporus]|uniref:Kinase-like protein n=2 Tax=Rhizopus microsporus TaxID=58291 RepID=A0A1X0R1R3_RHIZD|nr:kinase-like protein [Rhizopus microsporus var. microsporus]